MSILEEYKEIGKKYLLPFPSTKIAYFGVALAEPISCVIAAQEHIVVHVLKQWKGMCLQKEKL